MFEFFDGDTFDPTLDGVRLATQFDVVRSFMLRQDTFQTLEEIAAATGFPEASVSARLRDFRKLRFGGYDVERRRRGDPREGLFEYLVRRGVMSTEPTLAIVDGNHLLHRILHAGQFADLKTAQGLPTGGAFGALTTLRTMLDRFPAIRRVVVVWDGGHSPRRLRLLPGYKDRSLPADDPKRPEVEAHQSLFQSQFRLLVALYPLLGVYQLQLQGREADDVIAVLSMQTQEPHLLISEDKDLLQLVTPRTWVYRPIMEALVTAENFFEHTGLFSIAAFLLRLAILGDDSDKIPGVLGVGKTTVDRVVPIVDTIWQAMGGGPSEVPNAWDWLLANLYLVSEESARYDTRNSRLYHKIMEGLDTVQRNLALIALNVEGLDMREEWPRVVNFASVPLRFDELRARDIAYRLEFASVLHSWSRWTAPYRRLV